MKCEHIKPDGTPCKANAVGGGTLCNAHNGTLLALAGVGAAAKAAKDKARRDALEREQAIAKMGLDARLRLEAGKREEELIKALLDLALVDRDRQALLAVFDRLEGRATQRVVTEETAGAGEIEKLSTDELRRMLRVVPGGAAVPSINPHSGMDSGIAGTS